ncbi:MAG: hypothetical protein ACTSSH_00715 [Candidatus Heimdallarchaeota archaeon]
MKKSVKLVTFMLLGILLSVLFTFDNSRVSANIDNALTISTSEEDTTIEIYDFNNFTICDNASLIHSNNTGSTIDYVYSGGASDRISENYVFSFDDLGNCSYFDIYLKFNYTLGSIADQISFKLIACSNYDASGNYIGTDDLICESRNLNFAGIWDAWVDSGGKHVVVGYPNDVKDRYETNYGAIGLSSYLTEHIVRNESGIYSELYNTTSGALIIGHSWDLGVAKPVNYLALSYANGVTGTNTQLALYEITATLTFGNVEPINTTTPPSIGFPGFTAIITSISILSIACLTTIYRKLKN